jgi:hypothetical protein
VYLPEKSFTQTTIWLSRVMCSFVTQPWRPFADGLGGTKVGDIAVGAFFGVAVTGPWVVGALVGALVTGAIVRGADIGALVTGAFVGGAKIGALVAGALVDIGVTGDGLDLPAAEESTTTTVIVSAKWDEKLFLKSSCSVDWAKEFQCQHVVDHARYGFESFWRARIAL